MNGERKYDVAIIGGGLAGLTLAIQCAAAGYEVALFEKEKYPFHKVCGEYISLESWDFLERIGIPLSLLNIPIINELEVSDVKGNLFDFSLPLGGFGISRFKIDHLLYELALQKQANVFTDTKVQDVKFIGEEFVIDSSTGKFKAKTVAASYGKRSNLDVKWKRNFVQQKPNKLNNYIGVKYHVQYPQPKNKIALHNFHNGYCGISNIEDDKCCLCYLTTADILHKQGNSVHRMQEKVLYENPLLKKIFTEAKFLYEQPLTISQVSFEKKKQVENHVLMIGDAAGMITPLCGNGMSMAMRGSKLAFEHIHQFLQGNISRDELAENYVKQWQELFSGRLFAGRTVQRFFGGNTTTSVFLNTIYRLPALAKKLIQSTHGERF